MKSDSIHDPAGGELQRAAISPAILPSTSTLSTTPARIASCGMPKTTALSLLSARHWPSLVLDGDHSLDTVIAHAGQHDAEGRWSAGLGNGNHHLVGGRTVPVR